MAQELHPPFPPMDALLVDQIPEGKEWQYEPKWDGFRCLAFRTADLIHLQSKAGQPLARYFPELVAAFLTLPSKRFVLDGEIVIPAGNRVSFDDLLLRLHPAESRVLKLAQSTPAIFLAFDLLQNHSEILTGQKLAERRRGLEEFAKRNFQASDRVFLSPAVTEAKVARKWLSGAGPSLDGVMAKRVDFDYRSGDRTGMVKVKRIRTADCVVGGFRYGAGTKVVGSLLLGLYDEDGLLHHVGFTSAIKREERNALTKRLEELRHAPGFTGRSPGGPSRWNQGKESPWAPLKPQLVVEVSFDHFSGGRFRHGTRLLRFRPDKRAEQCGMDQVKTGGAGALSVLKRVRGGGSGAP